VSIAVQLQGCEAVTSVATNRSAGSTNQPVPGVRINVQTDHSENLSSPSLISRNLLHHLRIACTVPQHIRQRT
jgi:hypothetical protein